MQPLPPTATLLEKAAIDNGFDRDLGPVGGWMVFASTHAPVQVWLTCLAGGRPMVALSRRDVAQGLADLGNPVHVEKPSGAEEVLDVENISTLGRLLRRAFQLARTLPNELLRVFEQRTASMPRATEAERLVVQRVGQDVFRAGLMDYWEGKCAITGLAVPELLRASHIKPWAACDTDADRLDVFNGLLLAPHLDAAFDKGFITVELGGGLALSPQVTSEVAGLLGLGAPLRVRWLQPAHERFMEWHRVKVFRRGS